MISYSGKLMHPPATDIIIPMNETRDLYVGDHEIVG
jgi:hypothetical protein